MEYGARLGTCYNLGSYYGKNMDIFNKTKLNSGLYMIDTANYNDLQDAERSGAAYSAGDTQEIKLEILDEQIKAANSAAECVGRKDDLAFYYVENGFAVSMDYIYNWHEKTDKSWHDAFSIEVQPIFV